MLKRLLIMTLLLGFAPCGIAWGYQFSDDFENGLINWTVGGRQLAGTNIADTVSRYGSMMGHLYKYSFTEITLHREFPYDPNLIFDFDFEVKTTSTTPPAPNYYGSASARFLFYDSSGNPLGVVAYGTASTSYPSDQAQGNPISSWNAIAPNVLHRLHLAASDLTSQISIDESAIATVILQFHCYSSTYPNPVVTAELWVDNLNVTDSPAPCPGFPGEQGGGDPAVDLLFHPSVTTETVTLGVVSTASVDVENIGPSPVLVSTADFVAAFSNPTVTIGPSPPLVICPGDSATLSMDIYADPNLVVEGHYSGVLRLASDPNVTGDPTLGPADHPVEIDVISDQPNEGCSSVLVDTTRDGNAWWYPQLTPRDPNAPHQGKALADYLRMQGFEVTEYVGPGPITESLLSQYDVVMSVALGLLSFQQPYSADELMAYQGFVEQGGTLFISSDHYCNTIPRENLTAWFGLDLDGCLTGTITDFESHPITNGVTSHNYIAGSKVVSAPANLRTLARFNGEIVMGLFGVGAGEVVFLGDTNGLEGIPQPLTDNLMDYLCEGSSGLPMADAGPDQVLECAGPLTPATLDGSGSSDPQGDPLTYIWTGPFPEGGGQALGVGPVVSLPMGVSGIDLVVSDGQSFSVPDEVIITVEDTTPPELHARLIPYPNSDREGPEGSWSCRDDIDNDADGLLDAADPDCQGPATVEGEPGDPSCFDEIDNDHDGRMDQNDPDCHEAIPDPDPSFFKVRVGARDVCDGSSDSHATITLPCGSVSVSSGVLIRFDADASTCLWQSAPGYVEIRAPEFSLDAWAVDEVGNIANLRVRPNSSRQRVPRQHHPGPGGSDRKRRMQERPEIREGRR